MSIIVSSVYYCLTFTNECSACILNTFKTLLSTDPGILYKHQIWSFLGHRCVENNEWRGDSRWLSNSAELKHLNGVHVSTTHDMLYYGSENLYQVWCGVRFVRRQYLRSWLLSYNLLTPTLFARQLETNRTRVLCYSVWVFYEIVLRMVLKHRQQSTSHLG